MLKAEGPHHRVKLGLAQNPWHKRFILVRGMFLPYGRNFAAAPPFQVELTLRNQAAPVGAEPDNLPILLIEFGDLR